MRKIQIIIDNETLDRYAEYYFSIHTRATKRPIKQPYHESINEWMIMKRAMMNALKQKWKDFIVWVVDRQGYSNLHIKRCEILQTIYYPNNRRHDPDNSVPKFVLDGLVMGGMLEDDDNKHIEMLSLCCKVDADYPRTEIVITVLDEE